ncbi:MAG: hypothetical protein JST54_30300 [Deltaproteobacteria bacterium]|nr:hypothetical protein [Deltaproteobacteria bacterium]
MSDYDYENSSAGQQKSGSVVPWILLTFITVGAGFGMFFFNMQKEQAVSALEKFKAEYDTLKKRQAATDQAKQDLEKQLADMKTERDTQETAKNDALHKLDEATQQLSLAKAESSDKGKGKGGKKGIVMVKGKRHR